MSCSVRGLHIAVVIIHEWIVAGTCSYNYGSLYAKQLLRQDDIMIVSEVIFSWVTLRLHVDNEVRSQLAVADLLMMIHLCRHSWEVTNLKQCA